MRKFLSIIGSIILFSIVGYLFYSGGVILLDFSTELALLLTGMAIAILWWGFKPEITRLVKGRKGEPNVVIQESSLRFNKYPYLRGSKQGFQRMTNMVYAEITVENRGKIKTKECEVEIILKDNGTPYKSKVLSADSTKTVNPMTVSVDADGGTVGFHPLCLMLDTLEAFLPNHSLGVAGAFAGTLVKHGEYEILGRALYDGKQSKIVSLGKVKIPDSFLDKAKIPNDIQVTIDQGGFAVYVERNQDKVRAKIFGHDDDDDIRKIFSEYLSKIPQIDDMIEDNGKLRSWRTISPISDIAVVVSSSLVAKPTDREWREDKPPQLDPKFEHVDAVLFYPEEISWEKGERTPRKFMPRYKAIVNRRTKKAFWMLEYAIDLLNRGKIQFISVTWEDEEKYKKWFESKGITLIPRPATESDLLEGTEER